MKLKVAFAASIALLLPACATPHAKQPAIAITVDDLPLHGPTPRGETAVSVAQGVISALTAEHIPAYGFINGHWTVDDPATAPVQAWEVTPEKKIVWALRSWADPNLGPATTIQLLDEKSEPENVHFGEIK